jgi:hypothetical protein
LETRSRRAHHYDGINERDRSTKEVVEMTTALKERTEQTTDLVAFGERLGFYDVLSGAPQTPVDLATRAGVAVVFVRDWLNDQAEHGYLTYDPISNRYANWCELPS